MSAKVRHIDRPRVEPPTSPTSRRSDRGAWRRPGTVMVYVLGVLTLVALIGLILIARTHGEFKRVAHEAASSSNLAAADGAIRLVQNTLHRDIWGPFGNTATPLSSQSTEGLGPLMETNEPYDAPGPTDRWLSSTLPYLPIEQIGSDGNPIPVPTGMPAPWDYEWNILAWHRVSYLGTDILTDILQPTRENAFAWADNRRTPTIPNDATSYSDANLQDVLILQTPAPHTFYLSSGIPTPWPMVPGSTTNVTIAKARAIWDGYDKTQFADSGQVRRFPYFDTNADGAVDLYDADGDGIPDSPISFVVPMAGTDPNAPRQLYAVVRVVDHASMLNVNAASSWRLAGSNTLTFSEALPPPPLPPLLPRAIDTADYQRRGRRTSELLLDEVAHPDDTYLRNNRTARLMEYRSGTDPLWADADVVRRILVGGWPADASYFPYGLGDEASLRHRGLLASYDLRAYNKLDVANIADYRTIDRALCGSLLWTRQVDPATDSYDTLTSRWNRLNSNYEPFGATNTYEGYEEALTPVRTLGWRTLLQEDEPYAIRRPMFTTVSHEVVPPPAGVLLDGSGTSVLGLATRPVRFPYGSQPVQDFLMSWPVLSRTDPNPVVQDLPNWLRVQTIDINMSVLTTVPAQIEATKERYICYLAAAMYRALDGVLFYQGLPLASTDATGPLNREWLSWQFAINAADYRDSDNEPTVLEWFYDPAGGLSRYLYGIEKQPFLTEAYAYVTRGPGGDSWFFAVELFVPPLWKVPIANLYLRAPGLPAVGLRPLGQFHRGGPSGPTAILDGGTTGAYFVFCGDPAGAPTDLLPDIGTFYQIDPSQTFAIATDGNGSVELVYSLPPGSMSDPATHVLDVISPEYSGGQLAGDTAPGVGLWAKTPPGLGVDEAAGFSLLRSTHGWRFTTCWQAYKTDGSPGGSSIPGGLATTWRTLGFANSRLSAMDDNLPESVWPAMVATDGTEPVFGPDGAPGFGSGRPYEAFDSVGDLSRMLVIGPARYKYASDLEPRLPNVLGFTGENLPATAFLGEILSMGPLPDLPDAAAAGRIDFVDAAKVESRPWTWRLFDYLTTQSPLFDGIDNNGDGFIDWGPLATPVDPLEGADVLYRLAGRININTATLSVLRSVPGMSLLPTSMEYAYYENGGAPVSNPFAAYSADAQRPRWFWDFATAIQARRENRNVPLRLSDGAGRPLQTVAVAMPAAGAGGPGGGSGPGGSSLPGGGTPGGTTEPPGPFTSIAELATLMKGQQRGVVDASRTNDSLFQIDRFRSDPAIALWNHRAVGADPGYLGDPPSTGPEQNAGTWSPDYRYRRTGTAAGEGILDYVPIPGPSEGESDPYEGAGLRGRDIFLSRLTNLLTTRSDVYTVYIAFLDEDGHYVQRTQVTLDRSECFREVPVDPAGPERRIPVLPKVLTRSDGGYTDDLK